MTPDSIIMSAEPSQKAKLPQTAELPKSVEPEPPKTAKTAKSAELPHTVEIANPSDSGSAKIFVIDDELSDDDMVTTSNLNEGKQRPKTAKSSKTAQHTRNAKTIKLS